MKLTNASAPGATDPLPCRRAGLQVNLVAGGHAVHDGDQVHLLNETAFALWQLCDGRTSPEEMAAGVCELFGEAGAVVLADVDRTLGELQRRGLIEWQPEEPA